MKTWDFIWCEGKGSGGPWVAESCVKHTFPEYFSCSWWGVGRNLENSCLWRELNKEGTDENIIKGFRVLFRFQKSLHSRIRKGHLMGVCLVVVADCSLGRKWCHAGCLQKLCAKMVLSRLWKTNHMTWLRLVYCPSVKETWPWIALSMWLNYSSLPPPNSPVWQTHKRNSFIAV